jgi:hypothetical protein
MSAISESLENIEVKVKENVKEVNKLTINDVLNHFANTEKVEEYKKGCAEKVSNFDDGSHLLQLVMKYSPNSVTQINQALNEALSDGVLDPIDVPPLMVVFTKVYKTEIRRLFKNIKTLVKDAKEIKNKEYSFSDFVQLLTFLFDFLCTLGIINIPNKEKFQKSLQASLDLLDMMVDEDGLCSCF